MIRSLPLRVYVACFLYLITVILLIHLHYQITHFLPDPYQVRARLQRMSYVVFPCWHHQDGIKLVWPISSNTYQFFFGHFNTIKIELGDSINWEDGLVKSNNIDDMFTQSVSFVVYFLNEFVLLEWEVDLNRIKIVLCSKIEACCLI